MVVASFRGSAKYCALIASVFLYGCAGPQFREQAGTTPVVPVQAVIDSLKCGLAAAANLDGLDRSGIVGSTAAVVLNVDVITGRTLDGSIGTGIPISVGAGKLTGSVSASYDADLTNNTTTEFDIEISRSSNAACTKLAGKYQDAGFSHWLADEVVGINRAIAGPPYASMKRYQYKSRFIVTRGPKGGADFNIVPIKIGASYDVSRSDVQYIEIEIKAVHVVFGGKREPHSKPFNVKPKGS